MSTDIDVVIDEKIKQIVKEPSMYNVIALNDDATPIEWVIGVLKDIFKHSSANAEALTMNIHNDGSAVVGTYKYEIAEQKSLEATNASRNHGFPLQLRIEEEQMSNLKDLTWEHHKNAERQAFVKEMFAKEPQISKERYACYLFNQHPQYNMLEMLNCGCWLNK